MFAAAASFKRTPITVKTLAGSSSGGQVFAEPVEREVYLEDTRTLVRNSRGVETVSEAYLFDDPGKASLYAPESEVALPDRTAIVIKAARHEIGDPDVDHCQVWLT